MQRTLIIGCVIATLLMFWPMPELNRFLRYGMDLLHAPFFAILAFVLDQKRKQYQQEKGRLILWILLLILGALLEFAQGWVGRNSNWLDGLANLLGATSGILLSSSREALSFRNKWFRQLLALSFIGIASFSGIRGMWDTLAARQMFPVLADFESSSQLLRWNPREAQLRRSQEYASEGNYSGRLDLDRGRYPGASLELPEMAWTDYEVLAFDLFWNPSPSLHQLNTNRSFPVHIKLEDRGPNDTTADRFETTVTLTPGKNAIRIPLDDVRRGPVDRTLDLDQMCIFSLFTVHPEESAVLFLDRVRLE